MDAARIKALEAQIHVMQQALVEQSGRINEMRAALLAIEDVSLDKHHQAVTLAITAIARKALVPERDK